jgi:hypothetical protein
MFAEIRQRVIEKRLAANEAANKGRGPAAAAAAAAAAAGDEEDDE